VIRAADYPASPPGRSQPANPEHPANPPGRADAARPPRSAPPASPAPADPDVYVYRDTSGPDVQPAAPHPAESDAAYWYDLVAEEPAPLYEPAPLHEPARGPFEPLLSSSGPPPGAAEPPAAEPALSPADAIREQDLDDTEHARARKLEQIKDLYLTAEAIGEHNVDKHFDQLLAQQRDLISEYFKQSAAAEPTEPAAPEPAAPGPAVAGPRDGLAAGSDGGPLDPRDPGTGRGPGAGTPEDAACAAEPPRGW
jgi:hypothetical protein